MSSAKKIKNKRRKRRKFTPEFMADVVKLYESGSESFSEIASRLDLTETSVRLWVRNAAKNVGKSASLSSEEREELLQLRRDNKRLKMEREILKKAAAFFAKENS